MGTDRNKWTEWALASGLLSTQGNHKKAHLVNSACVWVLHGLLDGVPNVLHLEEARDIGHDGHDEHGKEVMGKNLDREKYI